LEEGGIKVLEIEEAKPHKKKFLRVKFKGVDLPEIAEALKGKRLYVEPSQLPPLREGEFYFFELEGSIVVDEKGNEIGHLVGIERLPSQDMFYIKTEDGEEIMLPVVSEFVLKIDKKEKVIVVRIPGELG
jgi:16S rRNA processing protein RimM